MMKPPPYDEMSERALPWHTSFAGQPMQHNFWLYAIIDRVMKANPQIRSIVEIGTGGGAVASVFGLWGVKLGIPVLTIDRVMRHTPKILAALGVEYLQADEFGIEAHRRILEVVGDQPTWLFCDGGSKRSEFREIGPLMPADSIVSAHDLGVEFRHEVDAADLCPHIFHPVHEEWWMELNVQLALYQRSHEPHTFWKTRDA